MCDILFVEVVKMKIIWKDVVGYEGLYEVSNTGLVRSVDRFIICKNGVKKPVKGKLLAMLYNIPTKRHPMSRTGVELWKDNKRKRRSIARLVAIAFIENPENKPQVNHIDGNPLNDSVENLEWVTNAENTKHAYDLGLHKKHNMIPIVGTHKKTGKKIYFESAAAAAKYLGVTHCAIRAAIKGYGRSKGSCGYTWKYR